MANTCYFAVREAKYSITKALVIILYIIYFIILSLILYTLYINNLVILDFKLEAIATVDNNNLFSTVTKQNF